MIPSPVNGAQEYKKVENIYEIEDLANCEIIDYVGKDIDLYNKTWEEIIK